jgi:hypothetical protein
MIRFFWVLVISLGFLQANAQYTVTTNSNAAALAQKIVGSGIIILNPQFKGAAISAGFFKDLTGTIGIDSGIILTTGRAASINNTLNSTTKGANAPASGTRTSTNNNSAGDADLAQYANIQTKDALLWNLILFLKGIPLM